MSRIQAPKGSAKSRRRRLPPKDRALKQLAQTMIQSFGAAAAGKVIELIRMQTRAGNRDAALKWHRVMSLIEEASRKSEVSGALLQTGDQPVKSQQ